MTVYDKPFLTIAQQLDLLRQRGMAIGNERQAAKYLQRIGYYRLSAYWYGVSRRAIYISQTVQQSPK